MKAKSKSKQCKAREFSPKVRKEIIYRDSDECMFCKKQYHMEKATSLGLQLRTVMHYIPRSSNGLGIPENGGLGCQYHHEMLDNGNTGRREEMLGIFREYLMQQYEGWNEEDLVYDKWRFLKV